MRVVADDLDKLGIDGWLCAQIGAAFIRHVITPVEPEATTAAGLVDGVTETTVLTACNAYDDAARLDGETNKELAQYPWMHAALIAAQNNGWHVNGWRKVDGISVFSITPPSGLLATQEFVKYDAYLAAKQSPGKEEAAIGREVGK